MKIIYDARWLPLDCKFDGVGRYSHELGVALATQPDVDITWLVHDERQLELLPEWPHIMEMCIRDSYCHVPRVSRYPPRA